MMLSTRIIVIVLVLNLVDVASKIAWPVETDSSESTKPRLSALAKVVDAPVDNPTTPENVALGRQLFFDPRLSGDNSMSCSTCHDPNQAFADGLARAKGRGETTLSRNTPTLLNVGFLTTYFWDGRTKTLEEQALQPIQSPDEMNQDLDELERELSAIPGYVRQFKAVFGSGPNGELVGKALAAFQRSIVTPNAPIDRYLNGDDSALSPMARQGLELFTGDAGCIRCHNGPLLSDGKYYRLGTGKDIGRGTVTGRQEDKYRFRTAPLRNVADTAPYMHNGSVDSLTEVVEFYFRTAPQRSAEGLTLDIEPLLDGSYSDIDAIVAFLRSLSGTQSKIVPPKLP